MTSEQVKTIQALQYAIQMEIDGKKFYEELSRLSVNEIGTKLFSQLAVEEDYHRQKFESIYNVIQSENSWPEMGFIEDQGKTLKNIFAKASLKLKDSTIIFTGELDAVQKAMEMENKTLDYYKECAANSKLKTEKKYYDMLAGEESAHHAILFDYYEFMHDPAGWFTVKERHSLDGG